MDCLVRSKHSRHHCPVARFPRSVWYLLSHFDNPHFIHRNKSHVTLQNNGIARTANPNQGNTQMQG
jgi:hypothetical protein